MKKRYSVALRMDLLILLGVIVIAGSLIALAYLTNAQEVDAFYMEKALQTARTLVTFLDGDHLKSISALLQEDEYQAIRVEAGLQGDDTAIRQYLEEHGELDYVTRLRRVLSDYRDGQGATYVYLVDMLDRQEGPNASMYILDPDEPLWVQGLIAPDTEGFHREGANVPIAPQVSHSEFGWLASCYEPIIDSAGNRVASVGVDIDMNEVMAARPWWPC